MSVNTRVSTDVGNENDAAWTFASDSVTFPLGRLVVQWHNGNVPPTSNQNEIGFQTSPTAWSSYITDAAHGWVLPPASQTADGTAGRIFRADPQVAGVPMGGGIAVKDRFVAAIILDTMGHNADDVAMAISDNGGASWERVDVVNTRMSGNFVDRPKLAVDPVDGTIWVYWVQENTGDFWYNWFRYDASSPPFLTRGTERKITGFPTGETPAGAHIAVERQTADPSKTILNLAWSDAGGSHDVTCPDGTSDVNWFFSWTADAVGGAAWTHTQFASQVGLPKCVPGNGSVSSQSYDSPASPTFVVNTKVTPHACFVALPQLQFDGHVRQRIFKATDHTTFTELPSFDNGEQGANDEWMSVLAFTDAEGKQQKGRLGLTWFDTRTDLVNSKISVWGTTSEDGGTTWSAPAQVSKTTTGANKDWLPGGWLGDYFGTAAGRIPDTSADLKGHFYPFWSDFRSGSTQQIFTAEMQ